MTWTTIPELEATGALSRASIFRRVKAGTIPSYVDAEGTRWVWSVREPWEAILTEQRETRALLEQLLEGQSQRETQIAPGPKPAPEPGPTAQTEVRSAPERALVRPFSRGRFGFDADQLLARVVELQAETGLSLAAVERQAGISRAFLSAALTGKKRGAKAAKTWTKIEAWIANREARKAA